MINFNLKVQEQFNKMAQTGKLFRVALTGQEIWDLYLASFLDGDDPAFRDPESSAHNCNHCKNFIRRYGNVVAIDENYEIVSMFDFKADGEFKNVAKELSKAIQASTIKGIFLETFASLNSLPYESCKKTAKKFRLGIDLNVKTYTREEADRFGVVKAGDRRTFDHLHVNLDKKFVPVTSNSIEQITGEYRDKYNVFMRSMKEINIEAIETIKDLFAQGSFLNGPSYNNALDAIAKHVKAYSNIPVENRENWGWVYTYGIAEAQCKFRSHQIGKTLVDVTAEKDINIVWKEWNKMEDPTNKHKPKAPISTKQIERAEAFIVDEGYEESFDRRLASVEDIRVSEIKHINSTEAKVKKVSLLADVKESAKKPGRKPNEFKQVPEVSIDTFMNDILPGCTSVKAYLRNNHVGNFVSMTTAGNNECKPIFPWDNNYGWSYNGNLTGKSQLAEAAESRGGRIDGAFRFTHSWNELEPNKSLMDLHVFMPGCTVPSSGGGPNVRGRRVGWNSRSDSQSKGIQDVDYTGEAQSGYVPVENITFPDLSLMPEGVYTCKVHNWSYRKSGGRGKAEIAFGNEVFEYEYPATKNHQWVTIAKVTLKDGQFSIEHAIKPSETASKEVYGLNTQEFHKVNLVCLSPNHWGDKSVGDKHYFFMLDECKADKPVRGFHNANLIPDFSEHRKVMEVFGATKLIEPDGEQLAGLGFNATMRDELVVQLEGTSKRMVKIKF